MGLFIWKNMIRGGATIWSRQTIESDVFKTKPDKWFKIWFYIINKVRFKKMGKFKKGQNFIKYEWISEATGATKNQIDHFLRWAKEAQMLATQKATRGMVVNVLKYEIYQDLGHYKSDTKSEIKATQERHYTKECNNNDKNESIREQSSQVMVSPTDDTAYHPQMTRIRKDNKNTKKEEIADKSASNDFKEVMDYYYNLLSYNSAVIKY